MTRKVTGMRDGEPSTIGHRRAAPPKPFPLISREELRRLSWEEGRTDAEIAQMFGVTVNVVNRKRLQMNLVQDALTSSQWSEVVRTIVDRYRQNPHGLLASGMDAAGTDIV